MANDSKILTGHHDAVPGKKLWQHSCPKTTEMYKFKTYISSRHDVQFGPETDKQSSLWKWSVDNTAEFWGEVWAYTGVRASRAWTTVVDESAPMFPRPAWFGGAKLNFAENLLFPRDRGGREPDEDAIAVVAVTEMDAREYISWGQLRERVRTCQAALRGKVQVGEIVAGYVANHADALVAMLAATSLGCVWSGISPDHGTTAVLDRLLQLSPVVLFADSAVLYNGKIHDVTRKLQDITAALSCLRAVVVINNFEQVVDLGAVKPESGEAWLLGDFLGTAEDKRSPLEFTQFDPDHPVYILFSSGTTGKPKCICHGAIGTLIQHKKEHLIHCDMTPGCVFFQFTTVTWMMWHWLVSGLASGVTIVLYDGSPFRPLVEGDGNLAMAQLIEELGVTHFGTSAKYLSILEQHNVQPKSKFTLGTLKAIYSTAAVLAPSTFEYIYAAFGPDLNLGSITGGTDIISLFGAPSPLVPVHSGEIQCLGLGMKVEAWDSEGTNIEDTDEAGDLVCTRAFPCMPVKFWGEGGEAAYRRSYFDVFPGVWHHGDFVKLCSKTRGLLMLGRSDGILKPSGVRFGSAEIYNVLLAHFPTQCEDALCIGRRRQTDTDEQVVLFVKMAEGHVLSPGLVTRIKDSIRCELSARHVPTVIDECPEIPVTTNGKKVEVAVKQILCGLNIKISASVANVECLEWYRRWAADN